MKNLVFSALALVIATSAFARSKSGTFTGEIMDKQCAQMQSHANMMKAEGARDARDCTLKCVRNGDSFALFDPQTKKVYPIEDEKKVREYAGQRVAISGTYDENADILHVKSIEAAGK